MIIVLKENRDQKALDDLRDWLRSLDLEIHYSQGTSTTLIGLVGDTSELDLDVIKSLDIVQNAIRIQDPYKIANRKFHSEDTVVDVGGFKVGGGNFQIIAGPCSIESDIQLNAIARKVKEYGAAILRGGAFKPRTSPYSFQGMGKAGISLLLEAKKNTGMPIVSEITEVSQIDLFEDIDLIQVGARNMQNFEILKELGTSKKPILLKRGPASTMEELLMSAEYIMKEGNSNIILCERGIKTFEQYTKNTLDISAVPVLKSKTHLPVIVDPSHGTGKRDLVLPMALAATAAGADGLIVEVHNQPHLALCDGPQSILPDTFKELVEKVSAIRALNL